VSSLKKKKIHLSLTEFALPCPRKGSIEAHSGFGRSTALGIEIHQQVQAARLADHPEYKAEVSIEHQFETDDYIFEIMGRMDGFFVHDHLPKIEEIKSTFNIYELSRKLKEVGDEHPYCLQLLTYGYFHWLQHKAVPELSLHLVSTRNGETLDLGLKLNLETYEKWLKLRLDELTEEVRLAEKRIKRRKKAAADFKFPFAKPRSGQVELIETIFEGMKENRPMLIQAPTGLGKTVGVMYPTLQEALQRGQRLVYLTPKNSQHSVAEDAIDRLQETGAPIKAMTLTAKSKMCLKNEPLCNPEYCEYAKDHYTKIAENKLIEQLSKKRSLKAKTFKKMAEEYQVCPFELQLDAAQDVDTVICDYNYVFAPRSAFGRLANPGLISDGKPNLVIDEAHNLPSRAMDSYSPSLSVFVLEKMREPLNLIPGKFRREAMEILDECIAVVKACAPADLQKACQIQPPIASFLDQDSSLRAFLSSYLNSDIEIQPRDPVMQLCFYWSEFTAALEYVSGGHKPFFTTFHPFPASIKITCCDASEMLKDCYKDYSQVVAFSATLKPFDFYSQLSGLPAETLKTAEFVSPFPKEHRKLLIIPQISSKYSERERNYPRISEAIAKIARLKRGNYIAFFPSFDFMERVLNLMKAPEGFQILRQERNMKREEIQFVLASLADPGSAHILFAVQGGVFSEGVDYPGEMVIGAFVVGPPLPNFDLEREKMREYYETHYASGFDYAYTYPAMAKAVQAAGRVIRSESDRGIIVLMDNRFIQPSFSKSMPQDWFEESPREAVSDQILNDLSAFWDSQNSKNANENI
jgi:DNA excision repair protein ERCC-2